MRNGFASGADAALHAAKLRTSAHATPPVRPQAWTQFFKVDNMDLSVSRPGLIPPSGGPIERTLSMPVSKGPATPEWQITRDLPARASRAKDDFGLPMPRQPTGPSLAAGQERSRPRKVSQERARMEADLLGPQKLQQLDRQFGKAEWARASGIRRAINPWERKDRHPIAHPQRLFVPAEGGRPVELTKMLDLDGLKAGSAEYIFVVSQVGAVILGEELPVPEAAEIGSPMPFLGHPTLTGGGPSRIAGELRYDREKDEFFITDTSGRFNLRFGDRGPQQLENVAERFRAAGLPVSVRYGAVY